MNSVISTVAFTFFLSLLTVHRAGRLVFADVHSRVNVSHIRKAIHLDKLQRLLKSKQTHANDF